MLASLNGVTKIATVGATMTRQSAKSVERDFPHIIEIVVPLGGLGERLNAMYDFHARHGIAPKRGQGVRSYDGSVIRWCFADPALAAAFASEFNGSLLAT